MTLVYTIDEDGDEYLYGRSVTFVPAWAVHDHHMDEGEGDEGEDEILPTNKGIKSARLWAIGRLSVGEKRDHARHRYPRKGDWKRHRRYQARGRVAMTLVS